MAGDGHSLRIHITIIAALHRPCSGIGHHTGPNAAGIRRKHGGYTVRGCTYRAIRIRDIDGSGKKRNPRFVVRRNGHNLAGRLAPIRDGKRPLSRGQALKHRQAVRACGFGLGLAVPADGDRAPRRGGDGQRCARSTASVGSSNHAPAPFQQRMVWMATSPEGMPSAQM